jgi:starvation-inducible DNA-binding protein
MQTQDHTVPVDIGINEPDRKEIAEGLSRLLADTYTLYLKTHNFHWNVAGPQFHALHTMFMEQYTELAEAVDVVAERIRTIGFPAPGSYTDFAELGSVKETRGVPSADEMVRLLVEGNEAVAKTARTTLPATERSDDQSTQDLLVERLRVHEKAAWMLRSMLDK